MCVVLACRMHRRIGNGRLEKLLVYSLLNFNEDIRAVALRRLPPEALHIQEAVQEQLAEEIAHEAEADGGEAVPAPMDAGSSADAARAEEDDDVEDTDVDSNVVEDTEEVPLTVAEGDDATDVRDGSRAEEHLNAEAKADGVPEAAAEEEAGDKELSSSEDDDAGVLGDVVVPRMEDVLPADLEDDYAWLFAGQERGATAVGDTELMQDAEDVGVAVAVAAAQDRVATAVAEEDLVEDAEDVGIAIAVEAAIEEHAEPVPKRRRLRRKQAPTGAWLLQVAPVQPAQRRPAGARHPWPKEQCAGSSGAACIFSTSTAGAPARVQPHRRQTHCLFCSNAELDKAMAHQAGAQITRALAALHNLSKEIYEHGVRNLARRRGDDFAEDFRSRVLRSLKRTEVKRRPRCSSQEQWAEALASRIAMLHLGKRNEKAYKKQVQRERAAARRKVFFPDEGRRHVTKETEDDEVGRMPLPPADIATNDTSLPAASRTERAARAEEVVQARLLADLPDVPQLAASAFQTHRLEALHSAFRPSLWIVQEEGGATTAGHDVPGPLQQLPKQVIEALRPLDIDTGVYERVPQGYRVHSSMIRFAWATEDVETKISKLSQEPAQEACKEGLSVI